MIGQRLALVETPAEILAKKIFYRASDFTARDMFDFAFLIEQGEARFPEDKTYRDKLSMITRRMKRSNAELRKSYASIARTGYQMDYDHCVARDKPVCIEHRQCHLNYAGFKENRPSPICFRTRTGGRGSRKAT